MSDKELFEEKKLGKQILELVQKSSEMAESFYSGQNKVLLKFFFIFRQRRGHLRSGFQI